MGEGKHRTCYLLLLKLLRRQTAQLLLLLLLLLRLLLLLLSLPLRLLLVADMYVCSVLSRARARALCVYKWLQNVYAQHIKPEQSKHTFTAPDYQIKDT